MVLLEPVEPAPLVGAHDLAPRDSSASGSEELDVPVAQRRPIGRSSTGLLHGVLADRLEHREARLAVRRPPTWRSEALVDQRRERVEHVAARSAAADRLDGLEAGAADEDRQPAKSDRSGVVEQVVAPGDGAAQRLLPLREVPGAAGQQGEASLEPGQHRLRA